MGRLQQVKQTVKDKGLLGLLARAKHRLYHRPAIDEFWYVVNYALRPSRRCIKDVQGSKMMLDLTDNGIHRDLFLYGFREPECTKIFREEITEGMKVADVGANIGYYVFMEAKLIGPSGKVYAIEPEPKNFAMLKKNIELNGCTNVDTYNMAISDRAGKISFAIGDASNHHRLAVAGVDEKTIEVDTITLDTLLEGKHVDVIRMDAEGAEWVIINGMTGFLNNGKPLKMFIEVHPKLIKEYGGDIRQWLQTVADAGFNVQYLVKWRPDSHSTIPYIKGRGPREIKIRYDRPLRELLDDPEACPVLACSEGHMYEAGYKLFLSR